MKRQSNKSQSNHIASLYSTVAVLTGMISLGAFGPLCSSAHAASSGKTSAQSTDNSGDENSGDDMDVSKLKQRYWQQTNSSDVDVVQNRTYKKAGHVEISVFGGFVFNDPFLTVHNYGATLGYHLNEYYSIHAVAWKYGVSNSSAYNTLLSSQSVAANTNPPNSFVGGELHGSLLYGKVSFAGEAILHYDLHLIGGAGMTNTQNGNYITPVAGIGQQMFLGERVSFNVDFRVTPYHEDIVSSDPTNNPGQVVDSRENWSDTITLGFSLFL
jgi:outer membrane beta-barrel protein